MDSNSQSSQTNSPQEIDLLLSLDSELRKKVQVRDLEKADLDLILDYWFSGDGSLHLDEFIVREAFGTRSEMQEKLNSQVQSINPKDKHSLVVLLDKLPIGYIALNSFSKGSAQIHAHFWKKTARGKGIGLVAGAKASDILMTRFNLDSLEILAPVKNPMTMGLAKKLGLESLETIELPLPKFKPGSLAQKFVLTKDHLHELFKRGVEELAHQQLEYYNLRDSDSFSRLFSDDVEVWVLGNSTPLMSGKKEFAEKYKAMFAKSPGLYAKVTERTIVGNFSYDLESVTGVNGDPKYLNLMVTYRANQNCKIDRIWIGGR